MDILVKITRSPTRCYLVRVTKECGIEKLRSQIGRKLYSKAIVTALTHGGYAAEVPHRESAFIKADLVLTEDGANWETGIFPSPGK